MLKAFFANSALVQAFTDNRSGPERLAASPWATATTPDQLIVAHILQSVATNPKEWRWRYQPLPALNLKQKYKEYGDIIYDARNEASFILHGPDLNVGFQFHNEGSARTSYWLSVVVSVLQNNDTINIETQAGNVLTERLGLLWEQMKKAEKVAEAAKQAMVINEKKWNLAENLLGMKRNEHGALVPKE